MTPKLLPQFLTLLRHRLVEVFPAPVGDPLKRTAEPAAGCLPLDHPRTPTRAAPVVREPQQVKSAWWSFAAPGVFGRRLRWPLERHQSGLLRMESQAEPAETLGQNLQDPPCVFFTGKAHDESSSPGEFHPQALTEPDGKLSLHPALLAQSLSQTICLAIAQVATSGTDSSPCGLTRPFRDPPHARPCFRDEFLPSLVDPSLPLKPVNPFAPPPLD